MKYLLVIITALPLLANADEPARMGRLFFTPTERASFDVLRQISKAPDKVIKASDISKEDVVTDTPTVATNPVVMNGYISRSDGKNTLWINNRALTEKDARRDVSVDRLNKDQVKITVNNKSVSLKPGQAYDPNTGKIYDHASDVPHEEAKSDSVIDTVSKKLGLEEYKNKAATFLDSFSSKPDATPAPDDQH